MFVLSGLGLGLGVGLGLGLGYEIPVSNARVAPRRINARVQIATYAIRTYTSPVKLYVLMKARLRIFSSAINLSHCEQVNNIFHLYEIRFQC